MQWEMDALRPTWRATPFAEVGLRIGGHPGEALVGHRGSAERFTYTAVGDAVNTVSRLEAANKVLGSDVLLSEATVEAMGASPVQTPLDGRDKPTPWLRVRSRD